jgi:hypothetical protein
VAGKGDNPRPFSVTPEQFEANFDAIDWNARERTFKADLERKSKIAREAEVEAFHRGDRTP